MRSGAVFYGVSRKTQNLYDMGYCARIYRVIMCTVDDAATHWTWILLDGKKPHRIGAVFCFVYLFDEPFFSEFILNEGQEIGRAFTAVVFPALDGFKRNAEVIAEGLLRHARGGAERFNVHVVSVLPPSWFS